MLIGQQILDHERVAANAIVSPYADPDYAPTVEHAWSVIRGVCLANRPASIDLLDAVIPTAWDGDRLALTATKQIIDQYVATGLIDLANRATRTVLTGIRGVCFVRLAPKL